MGKKNRGHGWAWSTYARDIVVLLHTYLAICLLCGPSCNTALDTWAALDLPGGGPFLHRVVSVDLNNQAKDANIIMTQNKQLLLHPNPTNPQKEKPKFPFQYVTCNHTHPRTLVTSKWVNSKQRSDQEWWSWVGLDQPSEKNLHVTTSNFP